MPEEHVLWLFWLSSLRLCWLTGLPAPPEQSACFVCFAPPHIAHKTWRIKHMVLNKTLPHIDTKEIWMNTGFEQFIHPTPRCFRKTYLMEKISKKNWSKRSRLVESRNWPTLARFMEQIKNLGRKCEIKSGWCEIFRQVIRHPCRGRAVLHKPANACYGYFFKHTFSRFEFDTD